VPTADSQILTHCTGYISDAGMTRRLWISVIGMDKEEPLRRFTRKTPAPGFEPAQGEATLCGVAVEIGADRSGDKNRRPCDWRKAIPGLARVLGRAINAESAENFAGA